MRRAVLLSVILLVVLAGAVHAQPAGVADTGAAATGPAVLARIALGFVLITAGLGSLAIAAAYWRPSGPTLLTFGAFASLYGGLILIATPAISAQLMMSRRALLFTASVMGYLLPVPAMMYAERIRGAGWHSLLRRMWQAGAVLAAGAMIYDAVAGVPWASWPVYRVFLIAMWVVLLPHAVLWRQRDPVESLVRTVGTVTLGLSVLHDSLAAFGWLPWTVSLNVFGIGVFIIALGFVTVRGSVTDQRQLAAVEHEMATAQVIQTSILPHHIPDVRSLDMAARYLPVRSVAGDLYDFTQVDESKVGILVADVAGHGLSAALIASMAKVAFSSQRAHAADPARVLTEINRVLCGYFDARYVTAAYVFIDTESNTLRYALAGHPPPLLWKAREGRLTDLREAGLVLGLFDYVSYVSEEVPFEPGDRLVLYTDGLTEAANRSGVFFGDSALGEFVRQHPALAAEPFTDHLLTTLRTWTDGTGTARPLVDDLTLVVASRT